MEPVIRIIQTAQGDEIKWRDLGSVELRDYFSFRMDTIVVNSSKEFQTHLGFGGAFTESAAYVMANASETARKEILKAYFNKDSGLAYNLGRTSINACDFSLEPYSYIEDGDIELKTFDMSREDKYVIPFIKEASAEAGEDIAILCAPWSPPAFMKNNKDMNFGGRLLRKYYDAWAKYMVKYVQGMLERGIHIFTISVQNEPEAKQTWASCKFDPTEEAMLAVDYLYEELKKSGLEEKIKIVILDHNRDIMFRRVRETLAYKNAKDIIWGIAYHWYGSDKSEILSMAHEIYPKQHLIFTEGCVELVNMSGSTSSKAGIGAWKHGETYGHNMINDFNNYNEGWVDWNLVLDEQGGPNYAGNFCEAPVMYNTKTDEVIYNVSYYYIGHFSRFIKPGAKRILCLNDSDKGIYSVAYKNPDGEIIVVVQNELSRRHKIAVAVDGKGMNTEVPPHSITTFIINK
jgi:glucosylceramidase